MPVKPLSLLRLPEPWKTAYTNDEHLRLFNKCHNDPRVAQAWQETGTLDDCREYLRQMHEDSHQIAVLAEVDDTFFSYHEFYWTKLYGPRTENVTGEHKWTKGAFSTYNHAIALNFSKLIDLAHKRSGLSFGSREKFFQVALVRFDG
ncbi:Acyl-CoA N-acyltransferase [Penicillium chermesinum]|uniref:Acyl-CoA N-acyltransferase n=1 Tax=Penicillium chermesinum TaxID=63820 RepID=A0A9W9PJA2_9EURO|nr:Acyl-CoA N-acyltransferase [Penicillium chermesinum]KAJ5247754.1 Acyl-CoA N-acyltransferase [Penicillium chermesinum]KAJ6151518.1 Acyl-CoA N-acyltransferase [Penicillium chermesinum]